MDYCSSCRRHLNGALVCPGCGAYAPDIAPPRSTSAVTAVRPAADDWFGAKEPAAASPADAEGTPPADVTDAPPAGQGRAARRRQLARWKKNKRRAAVATAVALVGGGLTLASLDRGNNDRAQAATAPDNRSMSLTDEPSAAPSDPASTPASPAATHRHTPTTPTARTPAVSAPQQHSVASAPRTAQSAGHPHTGTVTAHQAAPAAPQPRSTTPSTSGTSTDTNAGSSGTTAQPTPSTGTGSGSGSGTSSGTSTTPATGSTSHDQLCLLLVCLG
ncbi:SCO2400 family protein [Streptomyces sp. NPDC004059]